MSFRKRWLRVLGSLCVHEPPFKVPSSLRLAPNLKCDPRDGSSRGKSVSYGSWAAEEAGGTWVIRNRSDFVMDCAELDACTFLMILCFPVFSMDEFAKQFEFSGPHPPRVRVRWNEVLGEVSIHITTICHLDDEND